MKYNLCNRTFEFRKGYIFESIKKTRKCVDPMIDVCPK